MGLQRITPDRRQVIVILLGQGWHPERIALALDVSERTVYRVQRETLGGITPERSRAARLRRRALGVAS